MTWNWKKLTTTLVFSAKRLVYQTTKPAFPVINEPVHEIMSLFVLRKLILRTRLRTHLVGLDVWFLVGPFVYLHTSYARTAKALGRLRGCAGSPEPSLVAYMISTIISWAGWNNVSPSFIMPQCQMSKHVYSLIHSSATLQDEGTLVCAVIVTQ